MAETVMKFGPEWLRALSDGGPNLQSSLTSAVTSVPKYKLADYRYGREEMLALFSEKTNPPAELKECKDIFSEKCQIPLSLMPMSEDEHRLWSRCINSDAVLRLAGKSTSSSTLPVSERDRSASERGGLPTRGRGGGVDRGRGRGRTSYYPRGSSFEDEAENGSERRDFRTKTFERGNDEVREKSFERSIGRGEVGEDRVRKEVRTTDNWRSGNRNEDRSWRNPRRTDDGRQRTTSWRLDDRENEENDIRNGPLNMPRRNYTENYRDRSGGDYWDDADEEDRRNSLPEWSLDDGPCAETKLGTFDSSGAFREDTVEVEPKEAEPKSWSDKEHKTKEKKEKDQNQRSPPNSNTSNGLVIPDDHDNRGPNIKNEITKNSACDKVPTSSEPSISSVPMESKNVIQQEQQHLNQQPPPPPQTHYHLQQQQQQHASNTAKTSTSLPNEISNSTVNVLEEDGFAHLEKAAESMVAQWTAEEDQKERTSKDVTNKMTVLPVQHDDAYKWFYRDPQGELQGPFTPQEMLEWFTAGYFTMDLLVRRGCDEMFSHLGELIKQWNRVPFVPGQNPAPIRNPSSSSPSVAPLISNLPPPSIATPTTLQIRQQLMQQQHHQQQIQRQIYLNQELQMQTQLRQLLAQLKQREGFSELSQQQQQEVLVQHYVSSQQLQRRQLHPSIPSDQQVPNPLVQLVVPLVRGNSSPLMPQPVSSIWDLNGGVVQAQAFEEMQRQEQERRGAEEKQRKLIEEEQKRKADEEEQRRRLEELHRKLEEERMRKEELLRKQEEERRQKEEEERLRMEKIEEEKRRQEEQRRQDEIRRLEELAKKQREDEEKRRREAEEAERIKQQKKLQDLERQRKVEAEMRRQEQEDVYKRLQEQKKTWATQSSPQPNSFQSTVSLAEIQRLQEQKDREERIKQAQLQHVQAMFQAQNMQQQQLPHQQKQQQVTKAQLTWAKSSPHQHTPVKTLAEIQKEEAERLMKQKQLEEQKQSQNTVTNAGIWSNAASQLSWKMSNANTNSSIGNNIINNTTIGVWENCTISATAKAAGSGGGGFWDCPLASNPSRKTSNPGKSNDSALLHSNKTGSSGTAKSNSRSRKDEKETVLKSFENQRRQGSDEFTEWCIGSLEKFRSYVDIETFVAFLKDVEPPYEINDYVKSYLGENKEAREFAKLFIEKRSYYRNQAKKEAAEEPMWGPAPAITPSANKSSVASNANTAGSDLDGNGFVKAGKKKKKGKRVDNSILGFTVQADPDRVNAGEIEQMD